MYIFLDESGDLGFDLDKTGTSRYFVITVLVTNQFAPIASAIARTVKSKLRQKKKTRHIDELKGSNTTLSIKAYFHRQIMKHKDWYLHTIVLDKTTLAHQNTLTNDIDRLYNILAKNVLYGITVPASESIIQLNVDRRKTKGEIDIFNTFIRSHLEPNLPASCTLNIEHLRSQDDPGLQAADLFCHGIARKYERDDARWHDVFQDKIKRELMFRP